MIFSVYRSDLFKFLKPSNTYFCLKFYFLSILLYLTFNKYNIFLIVFIIILVHLHIRKK